MTDAQIENGPATRNLLSGLGGECFNDGDIGHQRGREMVARLEIGGGRVGDPDFAGGVFGDEDFEREVEGGTWRSEHKRCAGLGTAEDEQLGVWHFQAGAGGFAAVVDDGEELDAFGFQDGLQAGDGFFDGMTAGSANNAVLWNRWHGSLLRFRGVILREGAHGNQIDGHGHAQDGEDQSDRDGQRRGVREQGPGLLKLLQQPAVADKREQADEYTKKNQRGTEPEREAVRLGRKIGPIEAEFPQENSKAGEDEAESHESEAGANPGEKGSLNGEKVAGSGSGVVGHGEGLKQ